MPLATTTAQDAALDAVVATFPDDGTYRLFTGIPTSGGELTSDGGYAPADHSTADWAAASDGAVTTAAPVSFGTSTDAYADTAFYWAICDSSGAVVYWDLLPAPISVTAAGTAVKFTPILYFRSEA